MTSNRTMMLRMLEEVAEALGEKLRSQVAFVGGCTTALLITDEKVLGFSNTWFVGGLETSIIYTLPNGVPIKVFAAPWFLAAKLQALTYM